MSSPTRTPLTLLIVDDSPEDRSTYRAFLSMNSELVCTFLEADDVETGLQNCADVRVDCVILDYQLPDATGLEFLTRLRNAMADAPPVVMVTGRGNEEVAARSFRGGVVDYIPKAGLSAEGLNRAVRNAVQIARLQSSVAEEQRERELAEAELRDSEARFRRLVDGVRDYAIIMLDPCGLITSWNAGARQMFDYHEREIVGHPHARLFVPEEAASRLPHQELNQAKSQERAGGDRWYVRKDGSRLWASSVLTPIVDPIGGLQGYSWVLRDHTERLTTLQKLKAALGARASEVTLTCADLDTPLATLLEHVSTLLREFELTNRSASADDAVPVQPWAQSQQKGDAP